MYKIDVHMVYQIHINLYVSISMYNLYVNTIFQFILPPTVLIGPFFFLRTEPSPPVLAPLALPPKRAAIILALASSILISMANFLVLKTNKQNQLNDDPDIQATEFFLHFALKWK